jgi:hypothetical protein
VLNTFKGHLKAFTLKFGQTNYPKVDTSLIELC